MLRLQSWMSPKQFAPVSAIEATAPEIGPGAPSSTYHRLCRILSVSAGFPYIYLNEILQLDVTRPQTTILTKNSRSKRAELHIRPSDSPHSRAVRAQKAGEPLC